MPDFRLLDAGSICVLTPQNTAAKTWVNENIGDHQEWAGGVVIEHRYVLDIIQGIAADGLTIAQPRL